MEKHKRNYYAHIDALRAIAVFTVILFHINHEWLPGGFVGVDIFFVISGFLISTQLLKSVSEKTFAIKDFYARRVKRILPAALSVIAITVLLAQILFLPEDALKVAESGIWSTFSLPNVYFWKFQDTSYFAANSYTTPLLHYWSLGVEEQFYLFWPIAVLILLPRLNKYLFIFVLLFTIALSATIAEYLIEEHHSFVYYMLPTRAGELLVGALLATMLHFKIISKPTKSTFILPFVISGLVLTCFLITPDSVFPGWLYLVPTILAALFIWSGFNQDTKTYRLLTLTPILWLGKVSYSAYLVHWPILAFYRYGYGEPTLIGAGVLFVIILIFAFLNWKYVEERFRYSKLTFCSLTLKQFVAPASAIVLLSVFIIKTNGLGYRTFDHNYLSQLQANTNSAIPTNKYSYICQYWRLNEKHLNDDDCVIGDDKSTDILLWGDSNAVHYIGIIGSIANQQGWSFRNASHAACPPLLKSVKEFVPPSRFKDCQTSNDLMKKEIQKYDALFVSASFTHYQNFNNQFMDQFEKTITDLSKTKRKITIIGKAPVFENFDRHCLAKTINYPLLNCLAVKQSDKEYILELNERLESFADNIANVYYIDFNSTLCDPECSPYRNESPIYFDSSHIEILSSWELGTLIMEETEISK